MRVLLISVNREDFPDPVYPLGLSLVASALERKGHGVEVLDLRQEPSELLPRISRFRPEVVGLGLRNVDNLTWGRAKSYVGAAEEAVSGVRQAFEGPLVLGGSGFSLFPRELLERLQVPWGIVGEGEDAFPSLLEALAAGTDATALPGVASQRIPGRVKVTPPAPARAVPRGAPPAGALLRRYVSEGAAIGVQTKRGCPFRCTYCTYPQLEGRSVRLKDPATVADEVEEVAAQGVREIFFVDDAFNAPAAHAEEICRRLVERGVSVSWTAFAHPGNLSPSLARWMKRSGCAGLEFGTDSLADPVLDALGKGFTASGVAASVRAAWEAGIKTAHYLLLGSPGETPQTVAATLAAFDALPPAAVIAMIGVRIYPGTGLAERAGAEGLMDGVRDLLDPVFYLSPGIAPDPLLRRLEAHARERRTWIVPSLGIRCDPALLNRLRGRGGPTWSFLLEGFWKAKEETRTRALNGSS